MENLDDAIKRLSREKTEAAARAAAAEAARLGALPALRAQIRSLCEEFLRRARAAGLRPQSWTQQDTVSGLLGPKVVSRNHSGWGTGAVRIDARSGAIYVNHSTGEKSSEYINLESDCFSVGELSSVLATLPVALAQFLV